MTRVNYKVGINEQRIHRRLFGGSRTGKEASRPKTGDTRLCCDGIGTLKRQDVSCDVYHYAKTLAAKTAFLIVHFPKLPSGMLRSTLMDPTMMYQRICPFTLLAFVFPLLIMVEAKYESSATDATLKYEDIIVSHAQTEEYPSRKFNDLEILGFVTPWNTKGKDVAIREVQKGRLDVVSTVSWQVHPSGPVGGQDFDDTLYRNISEMGSRNFPRLLFEGGAWSISSFRELAINPKPMIDSIVDVCSKHSYDGVVLEVWQTLIFSKAMEYNAKEMLHMLLDLGEGIRKHGLHAGLVLPPYRGEVGQHGVSKESIRELSLGFSHFIVMTYDYSVPGNTAAGPISPLNWMIDVAKFFVSDCELGKKVLLGINFYGADFVRSGHGNAKDRHVVGHEVIELLRRHTPQMRWLEEWGEHAFLYNEGEEHAVFYPTRKSISLRLGVAREIGCGGVAIWELGQGLDYFFEEF